MIKIIYFRYSIFFSSVVGYFRIKFIKADGFGNNQVTVRIQGQNRFGISKNIIRSIKKIRVLYGIFCFVFRNISYHKICKSVVKKLNSIVKLFGRFFFHDNADQLHAILFRTCYQSLPGIICISGFSAFNSIIGNFSGNKLVLIADNNIVGLLSRRYKMIISCISNF